MRDDVEAVKHTEGTTPTSNQPGTNSKSDGGMTYGAAAPPKLHHRPELLPVHLQPPALLFLLTFLPSTNTFLNPINFKTTQFSLYQPNTTPNIITMSAPQQGRQSPDPENQSTAQAGSTSTKANDQGAGPSEGDAQTHSNDQKTKLSSNPEGPLEKFAEEKTSKSS